MGRSYFHLHLVSDSTGETLITVARAVVAQYEGVAAIQRLFMRALREAGAEAVESVAGKQGS